MVDVHASGISPLFRSRSSYCNPTWAGGGVLSVTDVQGVQVTYGVSGFDVNIPAAYDGLKGDLTNIVVGDFDGNGMSDFIRQEKGAWDDDAITTAQVWLSQGNGQFTVQIPPSPDSLKGDLTNIIVGDFNGDGRSDFIRQEKGSWDDDAIGTAHVYLSTPKVKPRFTIVTPNNYDSLKGDLVNIIVGDYDGDGKSDFIRQERASGTTTPS